MSNIITQYFGDFQDMATQHMLAPIQVDLTAVKAYAVGSYFIFNNEMYEVTSAITQGAAIVIGTSAGCNAKPSSSVMEEKASQIINVGAETDNEWSRCIVFDNGFKYMWGVKKNLNFAGDTAITLPSSFKDTSYFSAPMLTYNVTPLLNIQNIIAVNNNLCIL